MPAAVIGAGIGAIGSVAGGIASGKGAKKAAQIQATSAAQQMQLQRDMYNMNSTNFQPEIQSGNAAVNRVNQLLGLAPVNASSASIPFNNGMGSGQSSSSGFSPSYGSSSASFSRNGGFGGAVNGQQGYAGDTQEATATPAAAAAPQQSITDLIRSVPGYQFRYDQALAGTNANAYSSGMAGSGATLKALQDRAYNVADNYYQTYLGDVSSVANRGVGAKSALAGVGTAFVDAQNTTNQNAANNAAGYQIYKGKNLSDMINSVAGAAGSAFGSSFGGKGGGGITVNDKALASAGSRYFGS